MHKPTIRCQDTGDRYRVQFDAWVACPCGWESKRYRSTYSADAARIGAKAALAKHLAHPDAR